MCQPHQGRAPPCWRGGRTSCFAPTSAPAIHLAAQAEQIICLSSVLPLHDIQTPAFTSDESVADPPRYERTEPPVSTAPGPAKRTASSDEYHHQVRRIRWKCRIRPGPARNCFVSSRFRRPSCRLECEGQRQTALCLQKRSAVTRSGAPSRDSANIVAYASQIAVCR